MDSVYFHLLDHIYFCFFREEAIFLDLKKDRYILLEKSDTNIFLFLIQNSFFFKNGFYFPKNFSPSENFSKDKINKALKDLRNEEILSFEDYKEPKYYDISSSDKGVRNIDWRLTYGSCTKAIFLESLKAYWTLVKIYFLLKTKGFYNLIKVLQKSTPQSNLVPLKKEEWEILVKALNKACTFFPVRVKCLEWSATLTILALKKGAPCQLIVGIQNFPFLAHAWVESNGKVIADSEQLPKELSIILREPYIKSTL